MLNLWVEEDDEIAEEELELYSWFGDDEYRSTGHDDSNSLEEEEEEDEDDTGEDYMDGN